MIESFQKRGQVVGVSTDTPLPVTSGAMSIPDHDAKVMTYDGSGNILTITYKAGGSSGTDLATRTFTYDGSGNVLTDVLTLA